MNTKILEQKRLMQKAIDVVNHIEQIERVFGKVDPKHVKEETEIRAAEYAALLQTLVSTVVENAGMKLQVA